MRLRATSRMEGVVCSRRMVAALAACALLAAVLPCAAQNPGIMIPGSITVSIRDAKGRPLEVAPSISILGAGAGGPVMEIPSQRTAVDWVFTNLRPGAQYIIQVGAPGFESAMQSVNLSDMNGASASVEFFLMPATGRSVSTNPAGGVILAPRAEREVQQGIQDLKANKIDSAQRHLADALKMAPGNPQVNYLVGVGWLKAGNVDRGVQYLKNAISLDPRQTQALFALGMVRYKQGDMDKAIPLLEQAVETQPKSWQAHWLLADALLRKGIYEQAKIHAESALKYGKKKAEQVKLVLAVALAKLGKSGKALKMIGDYLKSHPGDPRAEHARELVANTR